MLPISEGYLKWFGPEERQAAIGRGFLSAGGACDSGWVERIFGKRPTGIFVRKFGWVREILSLAPGRLQRGGRFCDPQPGRFPARRHPISCRSHGTFRRDQRHNHSNPRTPHQQSALRDCSGQGLRRAGRQGRVQPGAVFPGPGAGWVQDRDAGIRGISANSARNRTDRALGTVRAFVSHFQFGTREAQ